MLVAINCTFSITAQSSVYPTYVTVDSTVHTNANDDNFYGILIDGTATITTLIVTAAENWTQGIRIKVTIDDVDVSNALTGMINIKHNKNVISTFSLNLSDTDYVPISNSHIDLDKVVVITSYINGQEKKLFTGLIDNIDVENTPFNIAINGFGYGVKLLDKRATIVSVQDLAISTKRNDVIKYLAEQASITSVNIPEMDAVTIDNSFSDQSIWEMIQKEAMVELYWVRFNEDAMMQLKLDDIKTDTTLYPTADWTYGEDRFERLNYIKGKEGIVNKIIILGSATQYTVPNHGEENVISVEDTHTWAATEGPATYSTSQSGFTITCVSYGAGTLYYDYHIILNYSGNFQYLEGFATVTGDGMFRSIRFSPSFQKIYINFWRYKPESSTTVTVNYFIKGIMKSVTYEERYDQISISITDPNSIIKYGEKDGGSINYPLLETEAQCEAVGGKIIQDSHRNTVNTNFKVPFNPLIVTGQTIQFKDSKIGLTTERYYIEGLSHTINPSGDSGTEVECVYYV